jgi:hypothetical protein
LGGISWCCASHKKKKEIISTSGRSNLIHLLATNPLEKLDNWWSMAAQNYMTTWEPQSISMPSEKGKVCNYS